MPPTDSSEVSVLQNSKGTILQTTQNQNKLGTSKCGEIGPITNKKNLVEEDIPPTSRQFCWYEQDMAFWLCIGLSRNHNGVRTTYKAKRVLLSACNLQQWMKVSQCHLFFLFFIFFGFVVSECAHVCTGWFNTRFLFEQENLRSSTRLH